MDHPRADIIKDILYSDSLYSLHSGKILFITILQKILISFPTILTLLFFFFFREISIALTSILLLFVFLHQKDFGTFHEPFFESFSLFFYQIKKSKKYFISFFIFNFLHQKFLYQNFLHQKLLYQKFLYQKFLHQNFLHQNFLY